MKIKKLYIGVTGHREMKFKNKSKEVQDLLNKTLDEIVNYLDNTEYEPIFNLGGANGVDNWVGEYCLNNNIKYCLYLPFSEKAKQSKGWNSDQKKMFRKIVNSDLVLSTYYGKGYFDRNRKIVENSDFILTALKGDSSGTKSGTGYTVNYAKNLGLKVFNILKDSNIVKFLKDSLKVK